MRQANPELRVIVTFLGIAGILFLVPAGSLRSSSRSKYIHEWTPPDTTDSNLRMRRHGQMEHLSQRTAKLVTQVMDARHFVMTRLHIHARMMFRRVPTRTPARGRIFLSTRITCWTCWPRRPVLDCLTR